MTEQPMVRFQNVSKRYGTLTVLDGLDLEVARGEKVSIIGPSGSGKTTVLRMLMTLETINDGVIWVEGQPLTHVEKDGKLVPAGLDHIRKIRAKIGMVFQSFNLFPHMTAMANCIEAPMTVLGMKRAEAQERAADLLEMVGLGQKKEHYPSQLSGGQQQRVAIARTLAYKPQVLLFDEPFGALDAQTRVRLRREIRGLLRQVNVPAIFITHDQEEALELGDRIAVLNAGRLEQIGTPDEVYNRPETEYVATFLGAANLLLGIVAKGSIEIGTAAIPATAETEEFRDGQAVKLVFRPEDVYLSRDGTLPQNCRRLTNGVIEEIHFVGAYERLTLRLDLVARQPADNQPQLYNVTINTADKKAGVPIIATRPKSEAASTRLNIGDRVAVGLTAFRVLPNFALASERASRIIDVRK